MSLDGGQKPEYREPMQTQGEHANSIQKGICVYYIETAGKDSAIDRLYFVSPTPCIGVTDDNIYVFNLI